MIDFLEFKYQNKNLFNKVDKKKEFQNNYDMVENEYNNFMNKVQKKNKERIESKYNTDEILDFFFEALNFSSSN